MPRPVAIRKLTDQQLTSLIVAHACAQEQFYRSWPSLEHPYMTRHLFRYAREMKRRENANARARESRSSKAAGR